MRLTVWYCDFSEEFRQFFRRFGLISDCMIIKDRETRMSRGFGFVVFGKSRMVPLFTVFIVFFICTVQVHLGETFYRMFGTGSDPSREFVFISKENFRRGLEIMAPTPRRHHNATPQHSTPTHTSLHCLMPHSFAAFRTSTTPATQT